jgi:hypothetical protein
LLFPIAEWQLPIVKAFVFGVVRLFFLGFTPTV